MSLSLASMKITLLPKRKGVLAVELALFASLIAFVTQPFVQPVKSSPSAADLAQRVNTAVDTTGKCPPPV